jgi:hypothetical protein
MKIKVIYDDIDLINFISYTDKDYIELKDKIFTSTFNSKFQVIGKFKSPVHNNLFVIKFLNEEFPKDKCLVSGKNNILKGDIKNPYQKSILGIAAFGNAYKYDLFKYGDKKRKYLYDLYRDLIKRVYTPYNNAEVNAYKDGELDPRWDTYEKFLDWVFGDKTNNFQWFYQLDKDLLKPGNKIYGPDTCIFLPQQLNKTLAFSKSVVNLCQGVSKTQSGKYRSRINSTLLKLSHQFRATMSEAQSFLIYASGKRYILNIYADIFFKEKLINQKIKDSIKKFIITDRREGYHKVTLQDFNYITLDKFNKSFQTYNELYDYYLTHDEEMIEFTKKVNSQIKQIDKKDLLI